MICGFMHNLMSQSAWHLYAECDNFVCSRERFTLVHDCGGLILRIDGPLGLGL